MTMTIEYRGSANRRIMTPADFAAYGIVTAETITWDQSNGWEVDVPDVIGIFLLGLGGGEFATETPTDWMTAFEDFVSAGFLVLNEGDPIPGGTPAGTILIWLPV